MEEKNDFDKVDEIMLPGFRFHPTDEELVGFYLTRKIQQRSLPIELIRQLDIYKYDPWDLPKLATTGEKEWYFYCPRDRKYRNSARPNRVTGAGFWKATGTDRPVYSSEGTKCIGLKKSLVFYTGRAAKGIKTDWMMHEFRLPSLSDTAPQKRPIDRNISANDSWAICRIFKKTNSMAQRALSQSWVSPLSETAHGTQFSSENISCTTEAKYLQQPSPTNFSVVDVSSYKPINPNPSLPSIANGDLTDGFIFSPLDLSGPCMCAVDVASMLLNLSQALPGDITTASQSTDFCGMQQQRNSFSNTSPHEMQGNMGTGAEETFLTKNPNIFHVNNQWGTVRSVGFPFSPPSDLFDAWNPRLSWDSPSYTSEISTSYSTNSCYN